MMGLAPILMYHDVPLGAAGATRLAVSKERLAEQLAYLSGEGYATVTVQDLVKAMQGGSKLPARAVSLTFDDGFADLHEHVLPLLVRNNFTATVYVTTGWIRDAKHAASGAPGRMLEWQQVRELAEAGIEIGGHSHSHPQLDQLRPAQVDLELRCSKDELESRLGFAVTGMAYPFGYSSARVRDSVRKCGYGYACAVGNKENDSITDIYRLSRLTISNSTSSKEFGELVQSASLWRIYFAEHLLTKTYAVVRRGRRLVRG